MGAWIPYSGPPIATDLKAVLTGVDLSAIVGTRSVIVYCEVYSASAAVQVTSSFDAAILFYDPNITTGGKGISNAATRAAFYGCGFMQQTDANGVLYLADPNGVGGFADIYLLGYIVPDLDISTAENIGLINVNNSWVDRTPTTMKPASDYGIILADYTATTLASRNLVIRPDGSSWNAATATNYDGGANSITTFTGASSYLLAMEVDATGTWQDYADALVNADLWVDSVEYSHYCRVPAVLETDKALTLYSSGWDQIDLSPYIGSKPALAFLRVAATTAASDRMVAMPAGYSRPWASPALAASFGTGPCCWGDTQNEDGLIIVPTDSRGRIDVAAIAAGSRFNIWLMGFIGQYDKTAGSPSVSRAYPSGVLARKTERPDIILSLIDPTGAGFQPSLINVAATDQLGRSQNLVTAGVVVSDAGGFVGAYPGIPTADIVVRWPSTMISGQRYTIAADAQNLFGVTI